MTRPQKFHIVRVGHFSQNTFPVDTPKGVVTETEFRDCVADMNNGRLEFEDTFVARTADKNPIGT